MWILVFSNNSHPKRAFEREVVPKASCRAIIAKRNAFWVNSQHKNKLWARIHNNVEFWLRIHPKVEFSSGKSPHNRAFEREFTNKIKFLNEIAFRNRAFDSEFIPKSRFSLIMLWNIEFLSGAKRRWPRIDSLALIPRLVYIYMYMHQGLTPSGLTLKPPTASSWPRTHIDKLWDAPSIPQPRKNRAHFYLRIYTYIYIYTHTYIYIYTYIYLYV